MTEPTAETKSKLIAIDIVVWLCAVVYLADVALGAMFNIATSRIPCRDINETELAIAWCFWKADSTNIFAAVFGALGIYHWIRFLMRGGGPISRAGLVMPILISSIFLYHLAFVFDDWLRIFGPVF